MSPVRRPIEANAVTRGWPEPGRTAVEIALVAELDVVRDWLAPGELDRLHRTRPEPGRRWASTRCWVRARLGERLGIHPADVVLTADEHGRPILRHRDLPANSALSITHSDTVVALALRCEPVGIDVEGPPPPGDDLIGLARLVGSEREVEELANCPRESRPRSFQRWWVRKEAVLKAQGHGFLADPTRVHVGVTALAPPPPWHVVDLGPVPGASDQLLAVATTNADESVESELRFLEVSRTDRGAHHVEPGGRRPARDGQCQTEGR